MDNDLLMYEQMINQSITIASVINFVLCVIAFVFKSIAIYSLSKKNGFKKLYLAFIPFFNFILLGKLLGKVLVFGRPVKNIGVWVCVFAILEFVVGVFYLLGYYVDLLEEVLSLITKADVTIKVALVDFIYGNAILYYVLKTTYNIVGLGKIFFDVSMMFAIFRKYVPQKYFLYGLLSVFFDFMFGFLLFSLRNKEPMTEEDYYREMARRRGYYVYRVNPNDFNNPYNPYNGQRPKQNQDEEDPFPEFSDKNSGDSSQNGDSKVDDLFD